MIVKVTQEDIDSGLKSNCCECPIALAMKRISSMPSVGRLYASCSVNSVRYWGVLPLAAKEFIHLFDDGFPVKPFEFEINFEEGWN